MRSTGFKWLFSLFLLVVAVSSLAAARVQDAPAVVDEPDVWSPSKATQLAHAATRDDHARWAVHAPHHRSTSGSVVHPAAAASLPHEPPRLAEHSDKTHHPPPLISDSATLGESLLDRVLRYTLWSGYKTWRCLVWLWRYLVVSPILGAYRLTRYSAEGTWRTTTWAGDRALWRPVRTVAAPLVYLVQGLLFLFVFTPYAVVQRLVRELYPVYVFLGAALALGTCMGLASALILYLGSFFFSDESTLEDTITKQVDEALPQPLKSKERTRRRKDNMRRWVKGESVLDQSIRELKRMRGQPTTPGDEAAPRESVSDDEQVNELDDYFGGASGAPLPKAKRSAGYKGKGKERSSASNGSRRSASSDSVSYASQSSSSYTAPTSTSSYSSQSTEPQYHQQYQQQPSYHTPHLGQLRMPVGATARGGWKASSGSASSSPASSPVATLRRLPSGANLPRKDVPSDIYAHHTSAHAHALGGHSASSSPLASLSNTPLASPDFVRQPLPAGLKRRVK